MSDNNPYSKAAGVYDKQKKETTNQRELEAHLLLKAANEMQKLHDRWNDATPQDIDNILTYNRKLWTVFLDTALENPDDRPNALRSNIVSLCNFIFKRTIQILASPSPDKVLVLIDINREIAAGLNTQPPATAKPAGDGEQGKTETQGEEKPAPGSFRPTSA